MDSLKTKNNPILNKCPQCTANIIDKAVFCGNCGSSISNENQIYPTIKQSSRNLESKSLWQWVSPAIRLWIYLLIINGVFGLTSNLFDITSPFYDLGFQLLSALFIFIECIKSKKQIKPLLFNFQYSKLLTLFEILGALTFIYLFMFVYLKVASSLGIESMQNLIEYKNHNWPLWSAVIMICLLPGIFEELAFRGFIMTRLEKVSDTREALIIQAAMFSVLHMSPAIFISHFIIGLILGVIRLRSKSLYPSMLVHITWNAIVVLEEFYKFNILS